MERTRQAQLDTFRQAVDRRVSGPCVDRHLVPTAAQDGKSTCRIDRFLVQLVALAKAVGPGDLSAFTSGLGRTVCMECARQGQCTLPERSSCCLPAYLPQIYQALGGVAAAHPA